MKKILSILIVFALVFASMLAFAGCNGNSDDLPDVGDNGNGSDNNNNSGGSNNGGSNGGSISGGDISGGEGTGSGNVSGGEGTGSGNVSGGEGTGSGSGNVSGGEGTGSGSSSGGSSSGGEVVVPDGYAVYENSVMSFAYPSNMSKNEGDAMVMFIDMNTGNNINITASAYDSTFENMTTERFYSEYAPELEARGYEVSNADVFYQGSVLVMAFDILYNDIPMNMAQFFFSSGSYIYNITVTIVNGDMTIAQTVLGTLVIK